MHVIVRVEIGSALVLRNSEIERLEVTQELSQHTRCNLYFLRDSDTDTHLDALLGQPLAVTLADDTGSVTVFTGTVIAGTQTHQQNHGSAFLLEGASHSWTLERPQTAYYTESRLADVASRFNATVTGTPPKKDHLQYVQFGETDFAFLTRIADDHGMFVRTSDQRHEIRAGFEPVGLVLKWGRDLHAVSASTQASGHGASGSMYRAQEKRDHRFRNVRRTPTWLDGAPRFTMLAKKLADRAANTGQGPVEELPFRSPTLEDARESLEQESERTVGTSVVIDGSANNIRVRAGDTVRLEESDAFRLPTQGTLGVTRVVHTFDGQLYSNDFRATPWAAFSNERAPERNMAHGVVTGVVVENVDPAQMGRVRVRLPWNDEGERTRWTRVASIYAGNMRGVLFLPEIGDEVLVAFEMGDPERPIVIGALWNGVDKAPTLPTNDAKRIITHTGNTIQLLDEDRNERIEIFTPSGKCWIQLANNDGRPLITVHSDGDIAFEAKDEIRFESTTLVARVKSEFYRKVGGNETADVSGNVVVKAGGKFAVEAMTITIKAGATLDAGAGGIHSITGAMVHIQPPGKMIPPNFVNAPLQPASPWKAQQPPKKGEGRTSQDPKVGR